MTVLVYVIAASGALGESRASGLFSALEYGQFFIERRTDVSEPVDDRLRDMAGVVGQMRRATAAIESAIRMMVTLVVLVDDFADMRDQIRHGPSYPRRSPLTVERWCPRGIVRRHTGR